MDKTACTQINEGQGYSKGLRIKLLYRVCSQSARAGFSEQYAKWQEWSKMSDKKKPLLKQENNSKRKPWKPGQSGNPKGRPLASPVCIFLREIFHILIR